jgi:hypothetical protein
LAAEKSIRLPVALVYNEAQLPWAVQPLLLADRPSGAGYRGKETTADSNRLDTQTKYPLRRQQK